jgi:hypothetical protein
MVDKRDPLDGLTTAGDYIAACVRDEIRHRKQLAPRPVSILALCGYTWEREETAVDIEQAVANAHEQVRNGNVLLLVDGERVTDMDQMIQVNEKSDITFLPVRRVHGL